MTSEQWAPGSSPGLAPMFRDPEAALCTQVDPEAFYPEGGKPGMAKRICLACTLRTECAEWAIANEEQWGTWGGLGQQERRGLIQARKRAAQRGQAA